MFPLRDRTPPERRPLVNWLLVLACIAVQLHVSFGLGGDPDAAQRFVERFGLVPGRVRSGFANPALHSEAPWTWVRDVALPFLTSPFVHGGVAHLMSNVWFLVVFGDNVEGRLGRARYLLFWWAAASVAAALHVVMIPPFESVELAGGVVLGGRNPMLDVPMVGASGAIAGVLGAYLVWFPRSRVATFVPPLFVVELPALLFLGIWFVLQFVAARSTGLVGSIGTGVAYWAHVGGFGAGVAIALLLRFLHGGRKTSPAGAP
jgi:membrane associated rhomboid family serine protease